MKPTHMYATLNKETCFGERGGEFTCNSMWFNNSCTDQDTI